MLAALVDLVLPRECVGCRVPGELICAACVPAHGRGPVPGPLPVIAIGRYGGGLREAVLAFKERDRRDLTAPLAALVVPALGELWAQVPSPGHTGCSGRPVLVPAPSTRASIRARGGAHLPPLTRRIARRAHCSTDAPLRFVRPVLDSAGLSPTQRRANLSGAMAARGPRRGQRAGPVVLFDDVLTTGTTLRECDRALTAAGWRVVGAVVLAATARRIGTAESYPDDPPVRLAQPGSAH